MNDLRCYDTEQLEAELERRSKFKDSVPEPLLGRDRSWTDVYNLCVKNVQSVAEDGRELKDIDHYVFEAAMQAVYGPDIWKWYNRARP